MEGNSHKSMWKPVPSPRALARKCFPRNALHLLRRTKRNHLPPRSSRTNHRRPLRPPSPLPSTCLRRHRRTRKLNHKIPHHETAESQSQIPAAPLLTVAPQSSHLPKPKKPVIPSEARDLLLTPCAANRSPLPNPFPIQSQLL